MKKIIAMLLAVVMILTLAACAPDGGKDTTGTTAPAFDGPVHCVCGANEGEEHVGDCTGEKVQWTAWTGTTLPTESGYYYAAHEANEVTLGYTDYTMVLAADGKARDIVVDLNGKAFSGPGDQQIVLDAAMTLTITDSSAEHKGSISASDDLTYSRQHALIHLGDLEEGNTATLNLYRVTLDASAVEYSEKDGAAISVMATNVLNMYNTTVVGGSVIGCGGAIYNGGTANLYDSIIYGAEVVNTEEDTGVSISGLGGAISTDGNLKLVDCTVYGAPAGRGGALNIGGGDTVMEGGIIYGANVQKAGCVMNLKSQRDNGASFTMKSSAKGEPVIDASQNTSGSFGGAINIDGYIAHTQFTMESGEIKGGTAIGAGAGGAVIVQDTMNEGVDGKGIFIMNGGTITGGSAVAETGNGGGSIRITKGGVVKLNGGTITGGKDVGPNACGGIKVESTANKLVIGGTAKITGSEGNDIFIATGKTITIAADWAGNGDVPMVVAMQDGTGTFAVADEGATLTDAQAAAFAGEVKLVDNTLELQ